MASTTAATATTTATTSRNSSALYDRVDNYFQVSHRGSSLGQEFRAGTASFLTLSYLLAVNPQLLAQAGVAHADAVLATALSAAVSCFIVGCFGNLPFGCAPGIGLTAYLTFGLVKAGNAADITLPQALAAVWWSGILVAAIAVTGLASGLMKIVPHCIKYAIVVGMGLLIAMIGMVSVELVVPDEQTIVALGSIDNASLQWTLAGMVLVASLLFHDVKGAILIGIALLTLLDWVWNNHWPSKVWEVPVYHNNDFWQPLAIFDASRAAVLVPAMGAFVLICIFDISGVMFGLASLGNLLHPETHEIPGSLWAFLASAAGTLIAASLGSTPIIVCVECASGVREGGRTGLTAIVIGLYFTASLFLAPLFSSVPDMATAPVLVLVGVMMMGESAKIKWDDMSDALPAFLCIILMPLTYSITNGMIFGLLASAAFYFTTGQVLSDARTLQRKLSLGTASVSTEEENGVTTDDEETATLVATRSGGVSEPGEEEADYGTLI